MDTKNNDYETKIGDDASWFIVLDDQTVGRCHICKQITDGKVEVIRGWQTRTCWSCRGKIAMEGLFENISNTDRINYWKEHLCNV